MLKTGKLKVAVCFSGQLRTWRKCIDSWRNILYENGDPFNVDVFCHIWNYNSLPNPTIVGNSGKADSKVSEEEIEEFISIVKPKSFMVENQRTTFNKKQLEVLKVPSYLSQYYGIMKASRLKKEYEIKNDFMYDVVVRARYDSYYLTNLKPQYSSIEYNTMEAFHLGWDHAHNIGRIGDICWMADSMTYDIIADYYLNLGNLNMKLPLIEPCPENFFFHYIKKCNVGISPNHWDIKLFRESKDHAFSKDKDSYETW